MTSLAAPIPKMPGTEPFRPWNLGKLIGQKPPLKLREVWAIRIRLQVQERLRDLAMFNLAIDSKLRGCDLERDDLRLNRAGIPFLAWI